MKISIENGQICKQTTMRERLQRFGETWIIYETNGFWAELCQEDIAKIWEHHPKDGSSTPEKEESEICI